MYKIKVFVDATQSEVEALARQIEKLVCDREHAEPEEACKFPWLIVTEELDSSEANEYRDILNR